MAKPRVVTLSPHYIIDDTTVLDCKITTIALKDLTDTDIEPFEDALPLGLNAGYGQETNQIAVLTIVGDGKGIAVEFPKPKVRRGQAASPGDKDKESKRSKRGLKVMQNLLTRDAGEFFAFDMAPLSMALYQEQGLRISNAVDIQSAFPETINRYSIATVLKAALGDEIKIHEKNLGEVFNNTTYDPTSRNGVLNPATRAWLARYLATVSNAFMTYNEVKRIDTFNMEETLLDVIAKIVVDSQRLESKKPSQTNHEFQYKGHDAHNNETQVTATAFKSRFRGLEEVRVLVNGEHGEYVARGRVQANGQLGLITSEGNFIGNRVISSIIGLGREEPTMAAKARDTTLRKMLQRSKSPDSPWIQNIWFNKEPDTIFWPEEFASTLKIPKLSDENVAYMKEYAKRLNPSQQIAVNTMLSTDPSHPITIIQGPPGTGKTSVIAFFVQMSIAMGRRGIWLIAQSNVAVKNIAEKLSAVQFHDYKVLVSVDFKRTWHDHLYEDISNNIIESQEFKTCGSRIKGCKVILCTLSMLSNPHMKKTFMTEVPFKTLVVDEASQIHIGDYISVFTTFRSLRKVCFIGDDKQLPPFGQEDAPEKGLPSIFEVDHLREHALFLNTQYRMPPQTGDQISEAVYDGELRSWSDHPIKNDTFACHFVDVSPSSEKRKDDSYWNEDERDAVIRIAQMLEDNKFEYKIISPYDAQRNEIEKKMKAKDMKWGNTCFNVDSFQGNEENYIIISLVRSRELGFLKNLRRTNVMLTRFKKGMLIVTSKKFLNGPGRDSLVGDLAHRLGKNAWLSANIESMEKWNLFGSRI